MIRTALAPLAALAALSGTALPDAQALPKDTAGTPGTGQSASPDGFVADYECVVVGTFYG